MTGQTQHPGPTKYCQACGQVIDFRAEVCPKCGIRQASPGTTLGWAEPTSPAAAPTSKFCYACRAQIDARAEICPKCGVRQPSLSGTGGGLTAGDATTRTGKSKLVASLLAILLGGLGIHKFYLGDTVQGVIYLIFFWTVIPAIIGFVEGIIWLTQRNEIWLAKYGDR
jgi:TM2 domain-containing membrane protein YozV/RNA polymerase subunit RPABC4/transcription elongation factor Spt4